MRCNKFSVVLAVAAIAMLAFVASANAATLSTSPTAPVVDGADIASLPTTGTSAGSKYWLWDGDAPGQTFTIGSDDVELNAITLRVWTTAGTPPEKVHDFWIGEVSGNSYIGTIHNETALQDAAAGNWNGDDYVTFTLDTPIAMDAGKTYGFDMVMASSTTGWQSGIPYLHTSGDLYSGGTRIQAGIKPTVHINPFNIRSGDMVFHLDMESAAAPIIPEPSTLVIWALGLLGLAWYGRRRRSRS